MLRTFLFSALFLSTLIFGEEIGAYDDSLVSIADTIKTPMPEWQTKVVNTFSNGSPKEMLFYSENDREEVVAEKRIEFFENENVREECDLITIEKSEPGYEIWNAENVPHGLSITWYENGEIESSTLFARGLLHGLMRRYYPNGKIHHIMEYKHNLPHGKFFSYYENGHTCTEGCYKDGKLEGDYTHYYSNGQREALLPYVNGNIEGKAIEWHENGNERSQSTYQAGNLHSLGNQPAVVKYDENHSIIAIQDYHHGKPFGDHIKYHSNERQSYYVHYVDGEKHGKESWFSSDGKLIGEGEYKRGRPIGKHWKTHLNGIISYIATYDKKGDLHDFIREFDTRGQKIAEYRVNAEGKLNDRYCTWHLNGQLKEDFYYVNGEFDGEQKQFYSSGQMKSYKAYDNHLPHGLFQEWNEEGNVIFEGLFNKGNREKAFTEWYANGQVKKCTHYKQSLFHGDHNEWNEDGTHCIEGRYNEGKRDGIFRVRSDKGQLLFEGAFDQNTPIETHLSYYENGEQRKITHFLNGQMEGQCESFYQNGQLHISEFFENGLLSGKITGFYEDGSPAFIRHYKEGKQVGEQKEFFPPSEHKETTISQLTHFNDEGRVHGEQKSFYASGATKNLLNYENGILEGIKALWDENGKLLEEKGYVQGRLEGRYFRKDGESRELICYYKNNKREGPTTIYYPEDATTGERVKAMEAYHENNQLHGEMIEYNPSGERVSVTIYKRGIKEGDAKIFHRNGHVAHHLVFKEGVPDGPSYQYHPNGQLYRQVLFTKAQKEGEEKTWFENGKVMSSYHYKNGKLDGPAKHWNKLGIVIFEAEYREGLQHGSFKKNYDSGQPRLEQFFVEGRLEGIKKCFDRDGNVSETYYENGVKIIKETNAIEK